MINNVKKEDIYFVEITLHEYLNPYSFYAICITGDTKDQILTNENKQIIFYQNLKEDSTVIMNKYLSIKKSNIDDYPIVGCYLQEMIEYVKFHNNVENSWLLDSINFVLDCMNTLEERMWIEHKKILDSFANYLTFNLDYVRFFDKNDRMKVSYALQWCIGVIITNCHIA